MNFNLLIDRAKSSKFALWQLNFLLHRFIPFNKPHALKIVSINTNEVKVSLPYKKSNLNHIKGLHACGLATAAEYASGLLLLYKLGGKEYRIIMESIHVDYKYQGKTSGMAIFSISEEEFKNEILTPLENEAVVFKKCTIHVFDTAKNLLCEATTNWQIKKWSKVKMKVN